MMLTTRSASSGNRRVRLAAEGGEAAGDGAFDTERVEGHDAPVAFDDGRRQGDVFVDGHRAAVQDANPTLGESEVELRGGVVVRDPVGSVDSLVIRHEHEHSPTEKTACRRQ